MKIKRVLYIFIAILIFLSSSVPFYAYDDSDNTNQLIADSAVSSAPVSSAELTQDLDSAIPDEIGILIADPETGDVIFTKAITDTDLLEAEALQPGTILKSFQSEILIAVTEYEANID